MDRGAGSHVYHLELAKRLSQRGHDVSIVCFASVPEVDSYAQVYTIPRPLQPNGRLLWRCQSLLEWRKLTAGVMALNLPAPDVVIGGEHLFLNGHCRRYPQTPWIYLPHSLVVDREIDSYRLPAGMDWVTRRVYRKIQRWALKRADRTLRFTELGCQTLIRTYPDRQTTRFVVNPVGVDLPTTKRIQDSRIVRLLSVGQLIPHKGIATALTALQSLKHFNWRYDIVGDGQSRDDLERLVHQTGLTEFVHFHGHQDCVDDWYRRADLLLFPSVSESFGLVLIEAMSHGVPCLAMRPDDKKYQNVTPEIIHHGRTGLLADGEPGFIAQLHSILQNPGQLESLGRNARQDVADRFTWERHLDRYELLFDELIREKSNATTSTKSDRQTGTLVRH